MHNEATPPSTEEAELMVRYGITRTLAYHYHYGAWRYSNFADALAQAKRDGAQHPNSKGSSDG